MDFLLEINVEELPAGYVRPALSSMRTAFIRELELKGISDKKKTLPAIENPGTKDRLICYIKNLPLQQKEVCTEIIGPPKRIAFDEKGDPTKQAIGFAKNQGVKLEDLKIKGTPKGE